MSEEQVAETRSPAYLPLMVLWGIAPGALMAFAGLTMKVGMGQDFGGMLLVLGFFGGPIALLIWSVVIVTRMDVNTAGKIFLSLGITVGACVVNLALAFGACAVIDPPFNVH